MGTLQLHFGSAQCSSQCTAQCRLRQCPRGHLRPQVIIPFQVSALASRSGAVSPLKEDIAINYTFRMHDARIGRFLSIDPLAAKYPWNSPYAFSENRVIDAVELEGLESEEINSGHIDYSFSPNGISFMNLEKDFSMYLDLI